MFYHTINRTLIKALKTKDLITIKDIFKKHCQLVDYPLILAILDNDLVAAKLATENGAKINLGLEASLSPSSGTLIEFLLRFGYIETFRWLAQTHLSVTQCFVYACYLGQLEVAKWLVAKAHADVNQPFEGGTGFRFAVQNDHLDIVQWLFDKTENVDNAFFDAVCRNHVAIAQWLVRDGTKIKSQLEQQVKRMEGEAVYIAVQNCDLEMVQWLLTEDRFKKLDGHRLLVFAIRCHDILPERRIKFLHWLIKECGVDINYAIDSAGCSALMKLYGHSQVGVWLLQMGAIAAVRDYANNSIFQKIFYGLDEVAEKENFANFVQALMEQGAGINTDFTDLNIGLVEQLSLNPQTWVLIGATINSEPFSYPNAINTANDLREKIGTLSIRQIKSLERSVKYLLARDQSNENLLQIQSILKGGLALKQYCLLFMEKNPQAVPDNYTVTLPSELVDEVKDVLTASYTH